MNKDDQIGTPFDKRCEILAELWMYNRDDVKLKDFFQYNDVGMPAAWLIDEELVTPTPPLMLLISETFDVLLAALEIKEDTGFDSLDNLFVG
jgi:hypothetical protein